MLQTNTKDDFNLFYRLTKIDESASLMSDISFDQTDDSLVKQPVLLYLLGRLLIWGLNSDNDNNRGCYSWLFSLLKSFSLSLSFVGLGLFCDEDCKTAKTAETSEWCLISKCVLHAFTKCLYSPEQVTKLLIHKIIFISHFNGYLFNPQRSSRKLSEVPPQAMKKPRSTGRTSDRVMLTSAA